MLVSLPGIAVFFCFTIAASVLHATVIAGFCFFVFLLCGASRLWGTLSIRRVSVAIEAQSRHMFIGDATDVSFSVKNDKLLPLIWLELLLPMPRNECIMSEGEFEIAPLPLQDDEMWEDKTALKKRFAFIMAHDVMDWTCRWEAKHRGIYHIDKLVLRSGDGLGLTQSQTVTTPEETPVFIVYPKIRPVNISPFLTTQWDGSGGDNGFIDDPTVMRGTRRYEEGDPWKRINWRMAARGQELSINIYETITPKAIHFIIDTESFCADAEPNPEFEEMLSLTASLLLRLSEARVLCGLSLPRSKYMPQTDIRAGRGDSTELLTCLAGCEMRSIRDDDRSQKERRSVFFPSSFDYSALGRAVSSAGRVYYIVRDANQLRERGLPSVLNKDRLIVLTCADVSDEDADALGVKILDLRSFGR